MTAPVQQDDQFDDAWEMLDFYLHDWGLESLSGKARDMLVEGNSPDVITLKLADTDEYKQRFKGNTARRNKNLRVLSPAEYIETERQYHDTLRRNGLPEGFYDQLDDFTRFIENDVSPQELNDRAAAASASWINAPTEVRDQWQRLYGLTPSMAVAAMLDPDRAMPILQRQINTTSIAAEAQRAFNDDANRLTKDRAEELAALGVEQTDARKAFGELSGRQARDTYLAGLAGDSLTARDQENELLLNDDAAGQRRRKAQQAEKDRFGGNYLATDGSGLARSTAGSY